MIKGVAWGLLDLGLLLHKAELFEHPLLFAGRVVHGDLFGSHQDVLLVGSLGFLVRVHFIDLTSRLGGRVLLGGSLLLIRRRFDKLLFNEEVLVGMGVPRLDVVFFSITIVGSLGIPLRLEVLGLLRHLVHKVLGTIVTGLLMVTSVASVVSSSPAT